MSRATIDKLSSNTVRLSYEDDTGEIVTRVFMVAQGGGTVKEDVNGQYGDVCVKLGCVGKVLRVADPADLLSVIRAQWHARKHEARRYGFRDSCRHP